MKRQTTLHQIILKAGLFLAVFIFAGLFSVTVRAESVLTDETYRYLQTIDQNFGYRYNDVNRYPDFEMKQKTGAWIRETCSSFGYQVRTVTFDLNNSHSESYFVRKNGKSPKRIIIGAHYDSVATKGVFDNGTGVAAVLSLARHFAGTDTAFTLDFCFFDGEETLGLSGSYSYIEQCVPDPSEIVCYINIDSVGAGDHLYVASGDVDPGNQIVRVWPFHMANDIAYRQNITLAKIPDTVPGYRTPCMPANSDQYYFNQKNIPYAYFFSNAWLRPDGSVGNTEHPHLYNSALPVFSETNGQILHIEKWEDLATLESVLPKGRIRSQLSDTLSVVSDMIIEMTEASPAAYREAVAHPQNPPLQENETITGTVSEESEEKTSEKAETESDEEISETTPEANTKENIKEPAEDPSADSVKIIRILGLSFSGLMFLLFLFSIYKIVTLSRGRR